MNNIKLIVGLGNHPEEYRHTRHNVGRWFVEKLAKDYESKLSFEKKIKGSIACVNIANQKCRLYLPATYMNLSGQALQAALSFYKIDIQNTLIVYDELDLDPGIAKFKKPPTGNKKEHISHKGVTNIIQINSGNFLRLRIGVGHPGSKEIVPNYVLCSPSKEEEKLITMALQKSKKAVEILIQEDLEAAMGFLHSFKIYKD